MQSFHQSRGRILFDTLCAFGMSASCALAWTQTYATAMLGPAAIAGLYGLVRFTDMFRRGPAVEEIPATAAAEPDVEAVTDQAELPPRFKLPDATPELPAEVVAALVRKPKRKTKRPAKAGPAEPLTSHAEPVDDANAQSVTAEPESPAPNGAVPEPEQDHAPIAPLFEPEPFLRKHQRAAFGRKFGVR
jgi:hypothetical protein